jgi:dihydropteroate synthase
MHIKGTPKNMQMNPAYDALIPEIMESLRESMAIARDAGITDDNIVLDPGVGFGKTFSHNLEILNRLDEFTLLGRPLLIGVSRKAFIGKILGDAPPAARLEGTLAAVSVAVYNGADIVRVHDVRETAKVVRIVDAIRRESCP